ncbi:MAG TPA: tetratricopeptide repeat protein [Bellilinea sp.]|nr:tetratricopeptide repeat protein [Bellilinea sp.]
MDLLSAYLPMDRRQALYRNKSLPENSAGAAIFADISGFTPLTELLSRELGPQRGAEELTHHLNQVYDALINQLHRFGGSVIGFSGDAITCWLDGDNGERAVACALAMQAEMRTFSQVKTSTGTVVSLELKTAVSVGAVRRFLVGDPALQVIEVLCGEPLDRLAAAEHQARRGEVVVDAKTAASMDQLFIPGEARGGEPAAPDAVVVQELQRKVSNQPWPSLPARKLSSKRVRPWLLKAVYDRLQHGQGEFLAELRPALALFLRFTGLDFQDDSSSQSVLDGFIRRVQQILQVYDGTLIQLTIGDKGSYLYAAFGAPLAHEDDALRAVHAAFALRELVQQSSPPLTAQIGITAGHMRVGAYGGTNSRTYGVLGDAVNLAARLMQVAADGQILSTEAIQRQTRDSIVWEKMPEIKVKGKTAAITVYQPLRLRNNSDQLPEPHGRQPLIGRETQIDQITQIMSAARQGQGQVIGIIGEAGIGKSELVRQAIRENSLNQTVISGECQAFGSNASYGVWRPIWQNLFGIQAGAPAEQQIETVRAYLSQINPALTLRLPLLAPVLNLAIPDNDLTRSLDAKIRKSSLEGLLTDCLQERARHQPLILILEDVHWIDPLSYDLLDVLCRGIANLPVLVILILRPPTVERLKSRRVSNLPYYHEITVAPLNDAEMQNLVRQRFSRALGEGTRISPALIRQVVAKAEGNPFYAEQSIDFLVDSNQGLQDEQSASRLQLPSSLRSLVLSRIDQLTESQKITIKVASVIGRIFQAALLFGVYGDQKDNLQLKQDLTLLTRAEIAVDDAEPELTYFFRHILMQEVAYENLPYATRALFHEQIAAFLERTYPDQLTQFLDLLAFHYGRSENQARKIEYFIKAGDAAKQKYANNAAIEYYQAVVELLEPAQRIPVTLQLCQVLEVVGSWDTAANYYLETYESASALPDPLGAARCQAGLGELYRKQGKYDLANETLANSHAVFENLGDQAGIAQTLQSLGSLATQQGNMHLASDYYQRSLVVWQQLGQQQRVASLYSNLGIIARLAGGYVEARGLHEKGLEIRRQLADRWAIAVSLNNLGNVALDQGDPLEARTFLEEAVALQRQVGDKYYIANALNNLANVIRRLGDYSQAFNLYRESLQLNRDLGDRWALAYLLEDIGCLASLAGKSSAALTLVGAASVVREAIKAPLSKDEVRKMDELLQPARASLNADQQQQAWETGRNQSLDEALDQAIHLF